MKNINLVLLVVAFAGLFSCGNNTKTEEGTEVTPKNNLPIYGEKYYDDETKDTVYHQIPKFELINQDGQTVTEKDVEGKIYVADFFFTSCQTICPKMTSQLKRVAKKIENYDDVLILSHTVDPETDTRDVLKIYAETNGINTKKWWFLTGDEFFIHEHGGQGYLLNVKKDSTAQGGFLHSEMFILVDKSLHIRGIYDGTNTAEVDRLMNDINKLKTEYGKPTATTY